MYEDLTQQHAAVAAVASAIRSTVVRAGLFLSRVNVKVTKIHHLPIVDVFLAFFEHSAHFYLKMAQALARYYSNLKPNIPRKNLHKLELRKNYFEC